MLDTVLLSIFLFAYLSTCSWDPLRSILQLRSIEIYLVFRLLCVDSGRFAPLWSKSVRVRLEKFFWDSKSFLFSDPIGKLHFPINWPTERPKTNSTADFDDFVRFWISIGKISWQRSEPSIIWFDWKTRMDWISLIMWPLFINRLWKQTNIQGNLKPMLTLGRRLSAANGTNTNWAKPKGLKWCQLHWEENCPHPINRAYAMSLQMMVPIKCSNKGRCSCYIVLLLYSLILFLFLFLFDWR